MRPANRTPYRRGAALVEAAIVIPVFLLLVLGTIDFGLAVAAQAALSEAAREGARRAIVHGELAPAAWNGGPWGPGKITAAGTDTTVPAVAAVSPLLSATRLSDTKVQVEWLDGTNKAGSRVQITVSGDYVLLTTFVVPGTPSISLKASSTMPIAH